MAKKEYFVALCKSDPDRSFLIPMGTKREHLFSYRKEGMTIVQVSRDTYDLTFNRIAERVTNHGENTILRG